MRPIQILLLAMLVVAPLSAQTVTLNDDRSDRSAYGGFHYDWQSPIHFSGQALIGAGSVSYHPGEWWSRHDGTRNWTVDDPTRDLYFVVEPSIEVEAKVGEDVRLVLGAGYRFVSGVTIAGLSSSDLAGPSLRAAFRLGMF